VYISIVTGDTGNSCTTFTTKDFDSVDMGSPVAQSASGASRCHQVYRVINPGTGSKSVDFAWSGGNNAVVANSVVYTGVDQANPNDVFQKQEGQATSSSVSVTTETGDLVVSFLGSGGQTVAQVDIVDTETVRVERIDGGPAVYGGAADDTGSGSITMDWDWTAAGSVRYTQLAANLNEAAASSAQATRRSRGID
jgi:hypothetical protein